MDKFKFEVSLQDANLIVGSLGKIPYEQSHELIGKLQQQYAEQTKDEKKEEEVLTEG